MKIKKNGKVVNLTESDLRRIVKKVLSEGKVDYTSCFKNFPSWVSYDSTEIGATAEQLGRDKPTRTSTFGPVRPLGTCEKLQKGELSAGWLSKITDKGKKEESITKTAQYCMRHLHDVIKDLKTGDEKKIMKHINNNYVPENNQTIEEWVKNYDFKKGIDNLSSTIKCMKITNF